MADDRPAPDLYYTDFYAWTQAQAGALRLRQAGGNMLDYDRLAEEIDDVGSARRQALRSAVRNSVIHLLELEASRNEAPRLHWRAEILNFRADAETAITPSLRREMEAELDAIHIKAARLAQAKLIVFEPEKHIDKARRWSLAALLGEADDPLTQLFPHLADKD